LILGGIVALIGPVSGPLAGTAGAATTRDLPKKQMITKSGWESKQTPNVAPFGLGELSGVSCPSSTSCEAVGYYDNGSRPLAELWNGKSWSLQSTPDAFPGVLNSVSCYSSDFCVAVGNFVNGTNPTATLALLWNGYYWHSVTTPTPPGAVSSAFEGVSCRSATACTAVGNYQKSSDVDVTLAEVWNGTSWKRQSTPDPSGATVSALDSVSCTSTANCRAVGYDYDGASDYVTLAEVWNGTSWKRQSTPNASGAVESILDDVSCSSSTSCLAVGFDDASATPALAEVWDGTNWKIESPLTPAGGSNPSLSGVSCGSASVCTAVGSYYNASDVEATLVEVWNGTKWAAQSSPNPSAHLSSELLAVSCSSTASCDAVGTEPGAASPATVAEEWNGTKWAIELSAPTATAGLSGVSCVSASDCIAVGDYVNASSTEVTLAEAWNGTSWTVQQTPNPTGAAASDLTAVSCTSATSCTAVGWSHASSHDFELAFAEVWNGTSWKVQSTPGPTGVLASVLYGVSCGAASSCEATGWYYTPAFPDLHTYAEVWKGSTWKVQSTPDPAGAVEPSLRSVSCASASACIAVGDYENSSSVSLTLAEAWNGATWTIQTAPMLSQGQLAGVSCTSVTACTAVGNSGGSGGAVTLAEVWKSGTWKVQSSPDPSGANFYLNDVSCRSTTVCTAVGSDLDPATPFAEVWNGTSWSLQDTPIPSGVTDSALSGLSCSSTVNCTAVGTYVSDEGSTRTLAETESG
jgi:hypothetical protein